jgi:hypothetical protein
MLSWAMAVVEQQQLWVQEGMPDLLLAREWQRSLLREGLEDHLGPYQEGERVVAEDHQICLQLEEVEDHEKEHWAVLEEVEVVAEHLAVLEEEGHQAVLEEVVVEVE